MPWNSDKRKYDKSPKYKVESGYDTVKKIAVIDETSISKFMSLVNDALSNGWVITQDITVYWNNGKTKYVVVLGKKE